jgi:hypothetical protein
MYSACGLHQLTPSRREDMAAKRKAAKKVGKKKGAKKKKK